MLWQKCSKFIGSPRLQALLAVQTAAVHAMLALLKVTDKFKLMKYIPEVEMPRMQLYNSCFNEDMNIKSKPGTRYITQSVLRSASWNICAKLTHRKRSSPFPCCTEVLLSHGIE